MNHFIYQVSHNLMNIKIKQSYPLVFFVDLMYGPFATFITGPRVVVFLTTLAILAFVFIFIFNFFKQITRHFNKVMVWTLLVM